MCGSVEGLVGLVHPERAYAVAVLKALALRHVVRALHLEVILGQLHLREPRRGVPAAATAGAGRRNSLGVPERGHGRRDDERQEKI